MARGSRLSRRVAGHGVTRGERRFERSAADTRVGSKSLEPEARLGQHLWIDIEGFNGPNAFMCQQRFGQGVCSRAEVKHQGWAGPGDFVCSLWSRPLRSLG